MEGVPTSYLIALAKDLLLGGFVRHFRSDAPHSCQSPVFPARFPPGGQFSRPHARSLLSLTCYLTSKGCGEISGAKKRFVSGQSKERFVITPLYAEETGLSPGRGARTYARLQCQERRECLALFCYSHQDDLALVVFTGTSSHCQWLDDFDYLQCPVSQVIGSGSGMAHWGFLRAYASLQGQISDLFQACWTPSTQLGLTGVSLGGALATLCAYDLADFGPQLYTFAAPSVFDPEGAADFDRRVDNAHRVANGCDLVPVLPLPVMSASLFGQRQDYLYSQTKGLFLFQRNLGNYVDNHTLAYLQEFDLTPDPEEEK